VKTLDPALRSAELGLVYHASLDTSVSQGNQLLELPSDYQRQVRGPLLGHVLSEPPQLVLF